MIYIYDLILNWSNKRRYEFFEWANDDEIEYVKKIPIFRISNFTSVINNEIVVDKSFLDKIYNKTEIYGNKSISKAEYCCVFCDDILTKAIACEFDDKGEIIYSSNIYFLDLEDVLELAKKLKSFYLDGNMRRNFLIDNSFLTRLEKKKKKILLDEINISYQNKDIDKLKYYYFELFNKECENIEELKNKLINSLDNIYSSKHDELYVALKLSIL